MWVWNVLTWNVTTALTMRVATAAMRGIRWRGGPRPRLSSVSKDHRVGSRPVHSLPSPIQSTGLGRHQRERERGGRGGISNIQFIT